MSTEQLTEIIIYDRFLKWIDSLQEHREEALMQKFCKDNEIERNAPLAMMFEAFAGGMQAGMELEEAFSKLPAE